MINVTYKKYGIKVNSIWFIENKDTINKSRADIVFLHGVKNVYDKSAIINKQFSLITDLTLSLEEIFENIKKNFRNEINRAIKEEVKCSLYGAEDIISDVSLLNKFKQDYEEFTKLKGIPNTYNEHAMEKYIQSKNIVLTKSFKDGQVLAQHVYICDGNTARLLYSVSSFRTEGLDSKLVGWANKLLHWHDIERFKEMGFRIFDWGGVSSPNNLNGVDKFKKGFGGQEEQYFNVLIGKSLIGRVAMLLKKLKRGG